jgi:stage II sporulation protein R
MKPVLRWVAVSLAMALAVGGLIGPKLLPSAAEPVAPQLIRFHVVANSDRATDQAVKWEVRDALVAVMGKALAGEPTPAKARSWIREHRRLLLATADRVLAEAGVPYRARLAFGWAYFPAKAEGSLTLPPGAYQALTVVLGQGRGQNWWCVLFPPLCFVDAATVEAASEPASPPERWAVAAARIAPPHAFRPAVAWFLPVLWRDLWQALRRGL